MLLIPNFLKYNPPNNPKVLQSWVKVCEEIPNCSLKTEFFSILKDYLKGYGKAFHEAMAKAMAKPLAYLPATDTDTLSYSKGGSGGRDKVPLFPDWIDPELWEDFREHRRKLRKPMSPRAEDLNLKDLTRLKELGQDPKLIVEATIAKGWLSFYSLDGKDRAGTTKADQIRRQTAETLKRGVE